MLKDKQTKHSKIKYIQYTHLKAQEYMTSRHMTNSMVETISALKSSIVRGVRANFVSSAVRTQCPLQCRDTAEDTQSHLLECPVLLARLTVEEEQARDETKYDDLYGDLQQQRRVATVMERLLEVREEELEERTSPPVGTTGPNLHSHSVDFGNI